MENDNLDKNLFFGNVALITLIIIVGFMILSGTVYTKVAIDDIKNADLSIELHEITNIEKYYDKQNTLVDAAMWKPEKYPCRIKYEITTETGEIIGTDVDCLKLDGTYTMYINRCVWNEEEIAWFNDCYLDRSD